jgi:hypothetical protein
VQSCVSKRHICKAQRRGATPAKISLTCHLVLWNSNGRVPVAICRITHVSIQVSNSSQGVGARQCAALVAAKHALGERLAGVGCHAAHIKLVRVREVWKVAAAGQLVCRGCMPYIMCMWWLISVQRTCRLKEGGGLGGGGGGGS